MRKVTPQEAEKSLEPARGVHVDYTLKGLLDTISHCREDISSAGLDAIRAIDAGVRPPPVAAYSVWRPLKPLTGDPIAVLNWTSPGDITRAGPSSIRPPRKGIPGRLSPRGVYDLEA